MTTMTQEPKMDPTLTLGTIVTSFSVGIVTGMVIMVALDAMGQRSREVDRAARSHVKVNAQGVRTANPMLTERGRQGLRDTTALFKRMAELEDEARQYELSESMGRDLPPAA